MSRNQESHEIGASSLPIMEDLELDIEELEEMATPMIVCVCSSTCSCTTSSCVGFTEGP